VRVDALGHQMSRITLYAGRTDFNPHDQTLNTPIFSYQPSCDIRLDSEADATEEPVNSPFINIHLV
jgi:hypothetical protein